MNLTKLLCALVMFVLPVVAAAADISSEQIAGGPVVIRLKGEIQKGDDEQFRRMSLRHPAAVVHLDSAGGALIPALEIGRIVRIAGYSTLVLPNTSCTSACALIWLAGKKRILDGRVGFHAAYRDNEGRLQESGAANALIGNYMTQLGLPAKAILFATAAPPDKILWLTAETRGNAGIDFEVPPPPFQIITRADRGVPHPGSSIIAPLPPKRSSGVRILSKDFFLTDREGNELYSITFLHRGLKLMYPTTVNEELESTLEELFLDELQRNEGWINIYVDGELSKREMVSFNIHFPSLSRKEQIVEVWVREDHQFNKKVKHRKELIFTRFFCGERSASLVEAIKYGAQGETLSSEEFQGYKARIAPDTVFEPIYEAVCP